MLTKFLCPKQRFNLVDRCKNLLKQILFVRNRPVDAEDVTYTLNTRKIQAHPCKGPQECYLEPTTIKLIIHGWLETRCIPHYKVLAEQYLQKDNYNIITVDWSRPAALSYINSVKSSVPVGKLVAKFLIRLLDTGITTHDKIHIVGHSLGAHIAGIAGKEVAVVTGKKVARITGLDPAKQLFEIPSCSPDVRLQSTDACMVDVTHTDCKIFGFKKPLGTVDFYINGTSFQPGCAKPRLIILTDRKELDNYIFCSHRKSLKHYGESISNGEIVGWKCDNLKQVEAKACDTKESIVYGENTPLTAKGLYLVKITSNEGTVCK